MKQRRMRQTVLWMTTAVAVLALLLAAAPGQAKDTKKKAPTDVAEMLDGVREEHGIPAIGGAIVRSDGLAALGVSGVRVDGHSKAVTTDDLWHIGSDTKAMTATLVARLHERGVLKFDATLSDVFKKTKMRDGWKPVTLRQLLGNRGGAPGRLTNLPIWPRLRLHRGTPTEARRLLLDDLVSRTPDTPPGTKYVYSNGGFALAGHAAETVARKSYEKLMEREVFAPLGIESAGFGAPGKKTKRKSPGQPWGHSEAGGARTPVPPGPLGDNPTGIAPAGGVHLSLADWAKFATAHLRGARELESEFLTAETFGILHTPLEGQTYALGWIVSTQPWGEDGAPIRVLAHDGSNTMWYATIWVAPDRDAAYMAVCNAAGAAGKAACHDVIRRLVAEPLR